MNTTTKTELAEVTSTDITTLPPAARAAVVLKSEQTRKDLVALAAQSAGIVTVLNADGREQAHRVGMTLKSARVTIEKTGKAAREDATAFSKAVIAEAAALIALVEPEETRVLKLRDEWDEKIEAEKQAKIAAERARAEAINDKIEAIRDHELLAVRTTFTIADFKKRIEQLDALEISMEVYQERTEEAVAAKVKALASMRATLEARIEEARIAAEAKEARKAEEARLAAERAELARLREEQAERERLARIESDRIATEQAAEGKRIADRLAAQEAELRRQREADAARVRAEDEARAAAHAEQQRKLEEQQAAIEAQWAAFAREQEEVARREADRVRLQSLVEEARADVDALPASLDELMACTFSSDDLPLAEPLAMPESMPVQALIMTAQDIVRLVADAYGLTSDETIDQLKAMDFEAVREVVA